MLVKIFKFVVLQLSYMNQSILVVFYTSLPLLHTAMSFRFAVAKQPWVWMSAQCHADVSLMAGQPFVYGMPRLRMPERSDGWVGALTANLGPEGHLLSLHLCSGWWAGPAVGVAASALWERISRNV